MTGVAHEPRRRRRCLLPRADGPRRRQIPSDRDRASRPHFRPRPATGRRRGSQLRSPGQPAGVRPETAFRRARPPLPPPHHLPHRSRDMHVQTDEKVGLIRLRGPGRQIGLDPVDTVAEADSTWARPRCSLDRTAEPESGARAARSTPRAPGPQACFDSETFTALSSRSPSWSGAPGRSPASGRAAACSA